MSKEPRRHTVIHLAAKRRGADRIKWPWRFMRREDTCDVYGDALWRRHAAASACSYIPVHDREAKFATTTRTDTRGRKYLRVVMQHPADKPLPSLSPSVMQDPARVALVETTDALIDQMETLAVAVLANNDKIRAFDTVGYEAEHPEAFKRHRHLYKPKTTETRDEAAKRIEKARIKMSRKLAGKDDDRGQSETKAIKAAQALREMNAQYRSNRGEGGAGPADEDVFADLELPDIIPPRTR